MSMFEQIRLCVSLTFSTAQLQYLLHAQPEEQNTVEKPTIISFHRPYSHPKKISTDQP